MRNHLLPIALGLCTLLPTGLAAADSAANHAGETTSYTFEDDLVPGDLVHSELEPVFVHPHGTHGTLIRAREHFVPEMMESVEDL